ncbi:hypothetical protein BpHYR1_002665 [Brachionus plicatilis]|uniref:Uncharacterized protein n=1 Tax=Brachionus plicatilis TaxID=10195 RepID=A0A3M7RMM8_BRAPC|nr:hypothetical protein BpHYR1_002665 [Brachionus plicatilis]
MFCPGQSRSGQSVQILKFVQGTKFFDTETIWRDDVRLALQQMVGFIAGYLGDSGEHVSTVGRGPFDAVAMVDAAVACLFVQIEIVQVVVEIAVAGAQIPAEQGCVCGEYGGHV